METNINGQDFTRAVAKGIVALVPGIGPLISEVIFTLIPDQRFTRLESFFSLLYSKLEGIEQDQLRMKFSNPENIDLLEDGMLQAVRALSEERKEYVASLIKNSLTNEQFEHIQYKQLLSILGELNDIEIILLKDHSFEFRNANDKLEHEKFRSQHKDLFRRHSDKATASEWYFNPKDAFLHSCKDHLLRLGLLKSENSLGIRSTSISSLGCMLLISIDQGIDDYMFV